jgi:hypothetical protein
MKYQYFLGTIIFIIAILFSTTFSFAMFVSEARINNFNFSTGIWAAPDAPRLKLPEDNLITNQDQIFEWFKSSQIYFEPETYSIEIYNSDPFVVSQPFLTTDNIEDLKYPNIGKIELPDGNYFWRVKTIDAHGNSSVWSTYRKLTIDKNPPQTIISVENSPRRAINEQIPNGNFEQYINTTDLLQDYIFFGNIELWKSDDVYQGAAREGNKMLRIGSLPSSNEGNNLLENIFSITFQNQSKTLSFYYNYFSEDEYPFDDPGFLLRINNKDALKLNNLDIKNGNSTGWKQFFYDVSDYDGEVTLDFFAGNNVDNFRQSWIYIDQISTGQVAVNNKAKFYLETSDQSPENKSFYCLDSCADENNYSEYAGPFSVDLTKGEHRLYFFSQDVLENKESPQVKLIYFDTESPQKIYDLMIKNLSTDSATLVFSAPAEDQATSSGKTSEYLGRISNEYIDSASSSSLLLDWWGRANQFDVQISPQEAESLEEFNILNLLSGTNYFVALKSIDASNNFSEISNVVNIFISPTPTPSPTLNPTLTPTLTPTITPTASPTPIPINLIQNAGFETGSLSPWERDGITAGVSYPAGHTGQRSVSLSTMNTTYSGYLKQRILGINPAKKYKVSGYFKSTHPNLNNAEIRIAFYVSGGTSQIRTPDESSESNSASWTLLGTGVITPPLTASEMEVRLTIKANVGATSNASAYFDDIRVEEIP